MLGGDWIAQLAASALERLSPDAGGDDRVRAEEISAFIAQENRRLNGVEVDKDHTGAQAAMLAVNALATDNRLDERRASILASMYNSYQAASKGPDPANVPSISSGKGSDITYLDPFLSDINSKRFPDNGVMPSTQHVSVKPNIKREAQPFNLQAETFVTALNQKLFYYAKKQGATFGWAPVNEFGVPEDLQTGINGFDVDKAINDFRAAPPKDQWISYSKDETVNQGLTWIAPRVSLDAILDRGGHNDNLADVYRNRAGLAHRKKGERLFALVIPGKLLLDTHIYRPRFCDNPQYPWFMVGSPDLDPLPEASDWTPRIFGRTCCLESLEAGDVAGGFPELVIYGLHGRHLAGERLEVIDLGEVGLSEPDQLPRFMKQVGHTALKNARDL